MKRGARHRFTPRKLGLTHFRAQRSGLLQPLTFSPSRSNVSTSILLAGLLTFPTLSFSNRPLERRSRRLVDPVKFCVLGAHGGGSARAGEGMDEMEGGEGKEKILLDGKRGRRRRMEAEGRVGQ